MGRVIEVPVLSEQKADQNEVRGIFSVLTITRIRFYELCLHKKAYMIRFYAIWNMTR